MKDKIREGVAAAAGVGTFAWTAATGALPFAFLTGPGAWLTLRPEKRVSTIVRGKPLATVKEAQRYLDKTFGRSGPRIRFAKVEVPIEALGSFWTLLGKTGSGKSIILEDLQRQLLRPGRDGRPTHRALINDASGDALPKLAAYGVAPQFVHTFHLGHRDGAAPALIADFGDDSSYALISTLVPYGGNTQNPFFVDAARDVLHFLFLTHVTLAPDPREPEANKRILRQVLDDASSLEKIEATLSRSGRGREVFASYFGPNSLGMGASVLGTIRSRTKLLEPVANAWANARSVVSLRGWLNSKHILVLGTDSEHPELFASINRFIVERIVALACSTNRPITDTDLTFIFADEFRNMGRGGKGINLNEAFTEGRKRGLVAFLGFQDVGGAVESQGSKELLEELLGQCDQRLYLSLTAESSCEFASKDVGVFEEIAENIQTGHDGKQSRAESRTERRAMLASEFRALQTNRYVGLHGVARVRGCPFAWRFELTPAQVDALKVKPHPGVPAHIPRPADEVQQPLVVEQDAQAQQPDNEAYAELRIPPQDDHEQGDS